MYHCTNAIPCAIARMPHTLERSDVQMPQGYDSNPVVAWQPVNKTVIMFVRQMDDLDVHEFHLADPKYGTFHACTVCI